MHPSRVTQVAFGRLSGVPELRAEFQAWYEAWGKSDRNMPLKFYVTFLAARRGA
jgi:hypothetical protein